MKIRLPIPSIHTPVTSSHAYIGSLALAIVYILYMFPVDFLLGQGDFFYEGDASQHVSGWLFYSKDSLRFPFLLTEKLNYPEGINIAFTDSIPLIAFLLRPFTSLLPDNFHYIGLWHGFAYLFQAFTATFTIRVLGARSMFAALIATSFALIWPALLSRLGHTSLLTHGLLIASLGFYFLGMKGESRKAYIGLLTVSLISLLIHPYLWAMCLSVTLAFLVDELFLTKKFWLQMKRGFILLGCTTVEMYLFGYLPNSGSYSDGGFGAYSLNLASPFIGGSINPLFRNLQTIYNGPQGEGYNYFGFGFLLLLIGLLITSILRSKAKLLTYISDFLLKHKGLICCLLLISLFSASHRITAGNTLLFTIPAPQAIYEFLCTFRSSGRFFWLPSYAILFGTLAYFLKKPSIGYTLAVCAALILQWTDLSISRNQVRATVRKISPHKTVFAELFASVNYIYIYPPSGCGFAKQEFYCTLQHLAAEAGTRLNTGHIARMDKTLCTEKRKPFNSDMESMCLYIAPLNFLRKDFAIPQLFLDAITNGQCFTNGELLLCAKWDELDQLNSIEGFMPVFSLNEMGIPSEKTVTFSPKDLPSQIGIVNGDKLKTKAPDLHGTLSFGPYIDLPPGKYIFSVKYRSDTSQEKSVGYWDICNDIGKNIMYSEQLMGTSGSLSTTSSLIKIPDNGMENIEIRTHYEGDSGLTIEEILIVKLE